MKVTWLGQAGLLFVTDRTTILIDPYFSDSAASAAVHRKVGVPDFVWDIKPDLMLFTHDHIDHYDPETVPHFIHSKSAVTVLSPCSVWEKVRKAGGNNNFVRVSPGVVWSHGDVTVTTVEAVHSDPYAVGFIIEHQGKTYYVTGDTLFCPSALQNISTSIDYVFLPINGKGNNMNAIDAAKFCDCVNARYAVPIHFGTLDDLDPSVFVWKNVLIPTFYKEMTF